MVKARLATSTITLNVISPGIAVNVTKIEQKHSK